MFGILLTQSSTPIIGQVAWILGKLMDGIFVVLNNLFGIQNIGISIIIFTIIIYTLMIPLTIKQQKFSKLSAVMNPEIQKIQKKYKGKKDQASMIKQQEETKLIYEKYGTSPTGGCMQALIQMPILFGLYQVIRNIPAYVETIKENFVPLAEAIIADENLVEQIKVIGTESPILMDPNKYDYLNINTLVDVFYKFQSETWELLSNTMPSLDNVIASAQEGIEYFNYFLGINIANSPMSIFTENISNNFNVALVAIMIPILSGISQFISLKIAQTNQSIDPENPMASSMNTMNTIMPIMSMFFCLTLPAGLGIYWIASAIVRTVQQVAINKYLSNISIDDMIKKNQEVAAKKRSKTGDKIAKINEMANKNTKNVDSKSKLTNNTKIEKPGSLASKANMVKNISDDKK